MEAVYAIDVSSRTSEIFVQDSLHGSTKVIFAESILVDDPEEADIELVTEIIEDEEEFDEVVFDLCGFETEFAEVLPTLDNWKHPSEELDFAHGALRVKKAIVSDSGLVRWKFGRRVIVPPFFRGKSQEDLKHLDPTQVDYEIEQMRDALDEIFHIEVRSDLFEPGAEEHIIDDIEFIEFTETHFEMQLTFRNASYITLSLNDPDSI